MSNKTRSILSKIVTCFVVIFFALAILIIILGVRSMVSNKPMSIFGYSYSVVPTESMEPEIHAGDFVLSKKVPYEDLVVGDNIVYYSEQYDIFIIHKIIRVEADGYITKGVNNPVEDELPVTKDNYISKEVWHGSIGNLGDTVANHRGAIFIILIVVLGFIFLTEALNFAKLKNDSKAKQQEEEKEKLIEEHREELRRQVLAELEAEKEKKDTK